MDPLLLVEQCYNKLPQDMRSKPWEVTNHGRSVLQAEDELNAYIAAYGEMHIVKCMAALQNFPFDDLQYYEYEIFDWGCGQGLATLTLLDMLHDRGLLSRLKSIYLIEPSSLALTRATNWVRQNSGPGVSVIPVNSYIPADINASMPEVRCSSRISINLFSNILDIRSLNLHWLANKTASLANVNYMVCIGPKFTQNTNTRISDFCGYFNPSDYFSCINSYPYSYTSRTHHAFGCETRCFVHKREQMLDNGYKECAEEYVNADPYSYTVEVLRGVVDDKILDFYNTLRQACETTDYEIFFRPYINCDVVDFVLISKTHGILLISTCENLEEFDAEFKRVEAIKSHLFNVHLKTIKIDSIVYSSIYNCVKTALFFPNHSKEEVKSKIKELNSGKNATSKINTNKDYYKYLRLFVKDNINLHIELANITNNGFKKEYYEELIDIISSKWHSYKDGDSNLKLSDRQKDIVRSNNKRLRVKGVAGCGKTQVVANRAVEQYLKTGERVLIVTFNIALVKYIRMRINQVPADFSPRMFEVTNYHQFFKSKANMYANQKLCLNDFDDPHFFDAYTQNITKYKSIIIDEVQDFKEAWIQSIVSNFLSEGGSVSLFGDGEQNIYEREFELETKMPPQQGCGFSGRWNEMNDRISMRIQNKKIAELSSEFASSFMSSRASIGIQEEMQFEKYYIKYWNVGQQVTAQTLASNIAWIIQEHNLSNRDVAVLGQAVNLLRDIEKAYSDLNNQRVKTMINFENASQYSQVTQRPNSMYIRKDLEEIRRAAKTHFTTDCEAIKFSTIHSFKGWESKTIILLLQPEMQPDNNFGGYNIQERENTPALIYTALTRARCNLFIINLGNSEYHSFFNSNIEQ